MVLVYCVLRAVAPLGVRGTAASAFTIACAIELGQFVDLVDRIGLGRCRVARVMLGTGFDPWDFLAYAGGVVMLLVAEAAWRRRLAPAHRAA